MISIIKKNIRNFIWDKNFEEIFFGSAWAIAVRFIAAGLGVITGVIIARIYGAEILGILAILNSFLLLATVFTLLGTHTSILRLIPEHLTKYSPTSAFKVYHKIQYVVSGVAVLIATILFLLSGVIAETIFSKPYLKNYFALATIFIIFKSLSDLNTSAVRGMRLIRLFALMQLLPSLSKLIILVFITLFFFHNDNPIYASFGSLVVTALTGIVIMHFIFKQKSNPNDITFIMPMKDILSISLPMFMSATITFIIGQTGIIMLGIFRPEAEVGYYSIAVNLATLSSFVLGAVNSMAAPKFSELFHSGKMEELIYVARKSTKLIFWTTLPIFFCLILFGKSIISLLYGQDFTVAYGAMVFLVIGQSFNAISGSCGYFMNMTGHHKIHRNFLLGAALINIVLNALLTPALGIIGAAVAGMFSLIFWNISDLLYIKIKHGITICYLPLYD